jgi:flagellar basal-body rod protein FlgB
MTIAAARQVVAAGNLANVNTPGFKAQEADFSSALDESLAKPLVTTDVHHIQAAAAIGPQTREVEGLQARRDGNTVQIDRELLDMTSAAGEFQRAQTALAAKFRLVRYAINEGR